MEKISEQRVYCKIRAQLEFPPTEIHADLQKVYGNGALKYATVCKWVRRFNDGRESIENDPRVGRPVSVLTEKNVATVKKIIEEDARYTVQEIEELSGIHSSSVLKMVSGELVPWRTRTLENSYPNLKGTSSPENSYPGYGYEFSGELVPQKYIWIYPFLILII